MRWMRPARKARTACGRNVFVPEADMTPGNVLAVRPQIHNHFVHASLSSAPQPRWAAQFFCASAKPTRSVAIAFILWYADFSVC